MKYLLFFSIILSGVAFADAKNNLTVGSVRLFEDKADISGCLGTVSAPAGTSISGPIVVMKPLNGTSYGHWCFVAAGAERDAMYSMLLTAKTNNKKVNVGGHVGLGNYVERITQLELAE